MLAAAENIHESALAQNPSQVTPASPQPSLLPATDQMPPVQQQQPAPRINRCLSFHGEQQREELPGQQSPLLPSTPTAISDSEGGACLADGPAAAEAAPPLDDRECCTPSPQPSPPPSPRFWESRRCSQLKTENDRFRIELLNAQAKLRRADADIEDLQTELREERDESLAWEQLAGRLTRDSNEKVGRVLKGLRPDVYAGYENGKVVYVWDRIKRNEAYEIERRAQENAFTRKMREQKAHQF